LKLFTCEIEFIIPTVDQQSRFDNGMI